MAADRVVGGASAPSSTAKVSVPSSILKMANTTAPARSSFCAGGQAVQTISQLASAWSKAMSGLLHTWHHSHARAKRKMQTFLDDTFGPEAGAKQWLLRSNT